MSTTLGTKPLAALTTLEATDVREEATPKPRRLVSLDVFRGITIAAMLLVNNPGRGTAYAPLEHADWHGWTPTDLVFPFFLFIVGVAIPFAFANRQATLHLSTAQHFGRIWTRALALVLLGVLLAANNLPWPFSNLPDGFVGTRILRIVGFFFVYGSIILLLVPWKWLRVSSLLPVIVGVLLLAYLIAMHFVRAAALEKGWPQDAFGNGAFNPDFLRLPGVLQRIGICYGVAASVALLVRGFGLKLASLNIFLVAVLLCCAYSAMMLKWTFPGADPSARGSLSMEANFARHVDEFVFDRKTVADDGRVTYDYRHTYSAYPDNEGIVSTLPAIATTLLGVLVGMWLTTGKTAAEHAAGLLALGLVVMLLGLWLDQVLMPINKNLWTPSFAVFTAGMGMLCLGFVYWLIEACGRRAWAWPFKVIGMNAIAAFVLANLLVRISRLILINEPSTAKDVSTLGYLNYRIIDAMEFASAKWQSLHPSLGAFDTPQNNSLAYALGVVLIVWLVTWVMYVCRVFAKV